MKGLWKNKITSESKTSPDAAIEDITSSNKSAESRQLPATPKGTPAVLSETPTPVVASSLSPVTPSTPRKRISRGRRRVGKGRKDERLCVSIEPDTREDLLLLAWHEDLTESSVVRLAIEDYLVRRKTQIDHARSLKSQIVKAG